jgi:hypothetical protein
MYVCIYIYTYSIYIYIYIHIILAADLRSARNRVHNSSLPGSNKIGEKDHRAQIECYLHGTFT